MRDRFELRARETVVNCLMRKLILPRVYFGARWPDEAGAEVDVVLIDREGSGDTHVVEIRTSARQAIELAPARLLNAPAAFRWIAFDLRTLDEKTRLALLSEEPLRPGEGAGRIGVIEVVEKVDGDLAANIRLSAERFPGRYYELSDRFAGVNAADIQAL